MRSITSSLVNFFDYLIFYVILQHYISKPFKYFRSNFLTDQVFEPYKEILSLYIWNYLIFEAWNERTEL